MENGEIEADEDYLEACQKVKRKKDKALVDPHKPDVFQAAYGERYYGDEFNRHKMDKDSRLQLQKMLKDHDP